MSITSLTLTNPGAEAANTSGWTIRTSDTTLASVTSFSGSGAPHSGSRFFVVRTTVTSVIKFDQTVDVSTYATAIDNGIAAIRGSVYYSREAGDNQDSGSLYFEYYASDGTTLLGSFAGTSSASSTSYNQLIETAALPPDTRFVRIGGATTKFGAATFGYYDDFALEISDNAATDYPDSNFAPIITQANVYAIVSEPAEYVAVLQVPVLSVEASETSSGLYKVFGHQFVGYALVKKHGDKRKLRAWTFPQDDHKFYVLQLGNSNGTLIYDQLTQQWARWQSPGEVFWRGEDGCDWEGFNVACDPLTGKIFKIDPEGRLDYNDTTDTEDTPITSIVVGGTTERFRKNVPCYMAELAISEGQPPEGIDATTVSISLRSNDTLTTYDHGSVPGTITGDRVTVRWYGLGLMGSPGRVFEITDTGYARRIDGLNIELGDQGGNQ